MPKSHTICKGQVASRKSQVCSAATFASFILTLSFTDWTTGRGYERVQWKLKTTMISWLCYNESTNYEILNTFVKKGKYINIIFMRCYIWSFHKKIWLSGDKFRKANSLTDSHRCNFKEWMAFLPRYQFDFVKQKGNAEP